MNNPSIVSTFPAFELTTSVPKSQRFILSDGNPHYQRTICKKDHEVQVQIITLGSGNFSFTFYDSFGQDTPCRSFEEAVDIANERAEEFLNSVWENILDWEDPEG